ncbi:DUF3987 domain-containing protein [Rickettsiales bacterium]|nr:DUF3987 domain-containing protein [Rickettsiales bacterium]
MMNYNLDHFFTFNNYPLPENIIQDGKIHRFGKDKKYWYIIFENWILIADWSEQLPRINNAIDNNKYSLLTDKQKEDLKQKIKSTSDTQEKEKEIAQNKAKDTALKIWNNLSNNGESKYLNNKDLKAIDGIKFGKYNGKNQIITALIDNNDQINSLQFIYDNGNKIFLKNGNISGCYSEFGNKDSNLIYICEGLATGLSILLAKPDHLIIIAYNCQNLEKVANNIIKKYLNKEIIITGDNDHAKENNAGKKYTIKTAEKFNLKYILPNFDDYDKSDNLSDFGDLRRLAGLQEVKRQLDENVIDNNQIIEIKNNNLKPVEKFDIEKLLPENLQEFVRDSSYRLAVPPDFIAISLIAGFSSLIASKVAIKPKKNDDWIVYANLWGGVINNPSRRKSPAMKEALFFFSKLEQEADEVYNENIESYQKLLNIYEIQKKSLEKELEKRFAKNDDNHQETEQRLNNLEEPKKVNLERFRINEATTQKITEILRDNQNKCLLLERDELAGFLSNLDKKDKESDRNYFLEIWNGNQSIKSDTIGRGSISANNTAISIIGNTTPDAMKKYLERAINSFNDGLLQRFQLLIYPDEIQNKYIDQKPNEEAKEEIIKIVNFLNENDFLDIATGQIEKYGKNYPYFSFDGNTQEIFKNWHLENDQESDKYIKKGKSLIAQHLSKYNKLLPSICLIFHLSKMDKNQKYINQETIIKAINFCNYLKSHAIRIYSLFDDDNHNDEALLLIDKIKEKIKKDQKNNKESKLLEEFTKRDLKRFFNYLNKKPIDQILNILIDHNYLLEREVKGDQGQKPTIYYKLNKELINK